MTDHELHPPEHVLRSPTADAAAGTPRAPSLAQALLPLAALVLMLATSVWLFGSDSSYGPNQIALLLAALIGALVCLRNGAKWPAIQQAMVDGVAVATGALFILLAVGALIGSWMLAGIVPTLIDYGLALLSPGWFYPAACLICALVGIAIGSSWTVAGTLGVALMGVSQGLGLSPAITAGAVISGAYFGDKMSPLSDTTNLAPAVAGSELFEHIRHMLWTTGPSIVLALLGFTALGLTASAVSGNADFGDLSGQLNAQFNLSPWLLVPLGVVIVLAARKFPAFPTILIGALLGAVFAVIFQPDRVAALADAASRPAWAQMLAGAWKSLASGYVSTSGIAPVDELLSRGGMASMLNTVWLIICAMMFGAVMEFGGSLQRMVAGVLRAAKSTGSLIAATLVTAFGTNAIAADQYIAIVLPGRIYRPEYEARGLAPVNLSRALEDAGTLTSALIPWNTCGAYMAATLGIATTTYAPFALFNWINPLVALVFAGFGWTLVRRDPLPSLSASRPDPLAVP